MKKNNKIKKREEFIKLAKPLIKFLNENYNPHASIYISCDNAEILCGEMVFHTEEYVPD
jgi:hypothetical protein